MCVYIYIYIYIYIYREMRGFAGREKRPKSEALGTANQKPASLVSPGPVCSFP